MTLRSEPGVVWRENRDFGVTVQADVVDGIQGPTVTAQINPKLDALRAQLPPGYRITVAGAEEESGKAGASIAAQLPLCIFIIFTLLMLQLHSFSRAAMVFLTGPLGLIGVVLALLAFNRPLGFVAILGVLALLGMITKNAVILIGQIDAERAAGKDVITAVIDASSARFRPIMLTAISTVLGMIPIAPTVFWGPMAFAIMGGLLVATMLTLVFLPTVYVTWFRGREAADAPSAAPAPSSTA